MKPFYIYNIIIPLLSLTNIYTYYIPETNHNITNITSFAFGSCYNLKKTISKYTIFNEISKTSADVFLWLGDAAYVDEPNLLYYYKQTHPNNWTRVEEIFNTSKSNKHYQEMLL